MARFQEQLGMLLEEQEICERNGGERHVNSALLTHAQYLPFPSSVKSYVQQADYPVTFQNTLLSKDEATNSSNGGSLCLPTTHGLSLNTLGP